MRALATCLAVLAAWHGARAEPAPPLSPSQTRREDAQRLREQLRELERERPPIEAPAAPPLRAVETRSRTMTAGVVLLCVAGLSAVTTLALYASASDGTDTYDAAKAIGLTTTAFGSVIGLSLVLSARQIQVAPAVGPRTAGLAISGRL